MKRSIKWLAAVVLLLVGNGFALAAQFGLVPGDVYGVVQGGIRQFDPNLNPLASFQLPNTTVTEGVAFTPEGHLIFSAFQDNSQHVIELGSDGSVLNNLDLQIGSLDRAAHIDIDSHGKIYVATTPNVIEIAPDFSSYHVLPFNFQRSSGVAIGPGDELFVTDQAADRLVKFDSSGQVVASFSNFFGPPIGIDFDPSGQLFATLFVGGQLVKVDPSTGQRTAVLSNLDTPSDIDFAADGSYYLSLKRGNVLQHRSADGTLLAEIGTGNATDSIAVMPNPSVATAPLPPAIGPALIGACLVLANRSRRRKGR